MDALKAFAEAAVLASVAPILLGGLIGLFKPFLRTDGEFANDVQLKKEVRVENVATRLQTVLETVEDLRGDPPGKPDVLGAAVREVFGAVDDFILLGLLRGRYKAATNYLLVTACLGIGLLLTAVLWQASRGVVALSAIAMTLTQVITALFMRHWALKLEGYQTRL